MFSKIKRKSIVCLVVIVIICILSVSVGVVKTSSGSMPQSEYTIVIDAGHGARDGGCVGVNGSVEKELNLKYAKSLANLLKKSNVNVIMTREDDKPLYDENAKNKKLSEMTARQHIIERAKPDLVISIHMNSFALKSAKGSHTFYKNNSEIGKKVGDNIQKSLHYYMGARNQSSNVGDYYILNCTEYTSVLVECGYLSNSEEEKLLCSDEYREKFVHSVFCGILISLGLNHY